MLNWTEQQLWFSTQDSTICMKLRSSLCDSWGQGKGVGVGDQGTQKHQVKYSYKWIHPISTWSAYLIPCIKQISSLVIPVQLLNIPFQPPAFESSLSSLRWTETVTGFLTPCQPHRVTSGWRNTVLSQSTSGGVYEPCIYPHAKWGNSGLSLLCLCDVFWVLINSIVCWFTT